ncbi:MAG: hypothetical protein IPM64_17135 [Phycisphaerales bacterium]|nr:hypothetical protein [Phycisphaerales bacterium]
MAANKGVGIGARIDRGHLSVHQIDAMFVGKRLAILISADPNASGDAAGQAKLMDTADVQIESVADSRRVSLADKYGIRLCFMPDSIDVGMLARFAGKPGTISFSVIGDAPRGGDTADEDGGED